MTGRTTYVRRRHEDGLTIIELMVSLLLSSMLSAGLFYLVSGQSKTYSAQLGSLVTQENLWGAMEYLQRQVRYAGYGGWGACPNGVVNMYDGSGGTTASTLIPYRSYNNCNIFKRDPATCGSATDGTDSFTVTYDSDALTNGVGTVRIVDAMPSSSSILKVNGPGSFKQCDLLILYEPGTSKPCTVIQETQDPQKTGNKWHIQHNPAGCDGIYNPPGGHNIFPTGGYGANALVIRFGSTSSMPRHFAVDDTVNPPRLVTWSTRNANPSADKANLEVVADNIEDLQLTWACDVNANGLFEETPGSPTTDEWAYTATGDTAPACGTAKTGQVRITLVGRTTSADTSNRTGFRPGAEDRAAGTVAQDLTASGQLGTYGRAVLRATATPHNIR